VARVEPADIAAPELLHHPADAAAFRWRQQQMHVVVHEDVGVQLAPCGHQRAAQQVAVMCAVVVIEEAGQSVVTALHDVLRNSRQVETG
jgi:hypothetical protein